MKLPPLVPQYKCRYVLFLLRDAVIWPSSAPVPAEHKLLHKIQFGEEVVAEKREFFQQRILEELHMWHVDFSWESFNSFSGVFDEMRVLGVQWEPEEFVKLAMQVKHPMDRLAALPTELRFVVSQMATKSPAEIAKLRLELFRYWNRRASELAADESELRKGMDHLVSHAVSKKKLKLFEEMLDFYNYTDKGVLDELVEGASLTGEVPATNVLPMKFSPALLTEDALRAQSRMRRPLVEQDCKGSGDSEVDAEVWKQTLIEIDLGWLHGPLELEEVPLDAPISRRFGLRQKHKIRLIDDFSESLVNQAVTVSETPTLHTVDVACGIIACWFGDCCEHLAEAIWWIGTVACTLLWSSFFDDYIVFTTPQLARSTELTASALFSLLGWDYATEGRKCMPFGKSCEALGVIFNLESSGVGVCEITNTESRVHELETEIDRVVNLGYITQSEAQRLRGRMQFAESQLFGRTGRRCARALRDASCRNRTKLLSHEVLALRLFVKLLKSGKPRTVCWDPKSPTVIFTDACYERESKDLVCGLAAVFMDDHTGKKFFFSCGLDEEQRRFLGEMNKKQIIFEAETFCAILAYLLWMKNFEKRKCFLYVDNEGTKFSMMKGSSENETVDVMCSIFCERETLIETSCWLARVPSYSNVADKPPRGHNEELLKTGFVDHSADAAIEVKRLLTFMTKKLGRTAECVVELPAGKQ
eukprot:s2135_g16.t1